MRAIETVFELQPSAPQVDVYEAQDAVGGRVRTDEAPARADSARVQGAFFCPALRCSAVY